MKVSRFQNICLIICFLGLGLNGAYCQVAKNIEVPLGIVVEDTLFVEPSCFVKELSPIKKSNNTIEIRFEISSNFGLYNKRFVFLTFDKKWSANYYHYDERKDKFVFESISKKINLDSVFNRLVTDNIFSLPDLSDLNLRSFTLDPVSNEIGGGGMGTGDGVNYFVTFKVGEMYRRYGYANPSDYAKYYLFCYELKLFSDIVKTFEGLIQ